MTRLKERGIEMEETDNISEAIKDAHTKFKDSDVAGTNHDDIYHHGVCMIKMELVKKNDSCGNFMSKCPFRGTPVIMICDNCGRFEEFVCMICGSHQDISLLNHECARLKNMDLTIFPLKRDVSLVCKECCTACNQEDCRAFIRSVNVSE